VIRCVPGLASSMLPDCRPVAELENPRPASPVTARWEHDIQVMVEGPGTCRWTRFEFNRKKQMEDAAKLASMVLGPPLSTDIATPAYDHSIQAPSGAALAAGTHGRMALLRDPQGTPGPAQPEIDVRRGPLKSPYKSSRPRARPRLHRPGAPATATTNSRPAPRYAFRLEQAVRSHRSTRTCPANTTTKPCRPTSTKKPNSAQCAGPKHCPMQTTRSRLRIWRIGRRAEGLRSSRKQLRLC